MFGFSLEFRAHFEVIRKKDMHEFSQLQIYNDKNVAASKLVEMKIT